MKHKLCYGDLAFRFRVQLEFRVHGEAGAHRVVELRNHLGAHIDTSATQSFRY